jgi:glyoxylase-like metal-dependent hydrolase (beta-lactamase superfamily II)
VRHRQRPGELGAVRAAALALAAAWLAGCAMGPEAQTAYVFIPGSFESGRQPDGNTVLLATSGGMVAVDTGRRRGHADKIAKAAREGGGLLAIVNTHWHLDHVSGNLPLRESWPDAEVYANGPAFAEAAEGFLARGLEANRKMLADPATPPGLAEDLRGDVATVEQVSGLMPTRSVASSEDVVLGGRRLRLNLAQAASAGDIWLWDEQARLVVAGDLVTLPAPFLDTACPRTWLAELDRVLALPFVTLAPGHGRLMSREDVRVYRDAFAQLIECSRSAADAEACAAGWAQAAAGLLETPGDRDAAGSYALYYTSQVLRRPEAAPAWCSQDAG